MLQIKSLREQVYQYLRDQMQNGRLLPGSPINISEISQTLGISKTPLRDALIQLETEGFVTILPRRGYIVNGLSLDDVKYLYEIIGSLEAGVIVSMFGNIGPRLIDIMERMNSEMRRAVMDGDFESYYDLNLDFHNSYLALSDNEVMKQILKVMKQRLYDFPRRSYLEEWELSNCDEHQQFIDMVKNGEPERAAGVMRDVHWCFKVQEKHIRRFYLQVEKEIQNEHAIRKANGLG